MTNLLVFVWLHLQLVLAGSVIWLFVYDACNCTTFADMFLQILLVFWLVFLVLFLKRWLVTVLYISNVC